jgi:DNA modification methylase
MSQPKKRRPSLVRRALVIEDLPIGDLVPDPRNARRHSKKQVEGIAASINEFGFTNPILIDEANSVVAGHARLDAAKLTGMTNVPCIRLVGLNRHQKKALAIADNKLHDMSFFDPEQLLATFAELEVVEYDLEVTGFSTAELDVLQESVALAIATDPADKMPAPGLPPVTRTGDLWVLDRHRLLCGNSLEEESFDRLLGEDRADLVIADMPYNVPIDGHVSGLGKVRHREFLYASGEQSPVQFTGFLSLAMSLMARYSTDGSIHFQFMDWRHMNEMLQAGTTAYSELKNLIVWDKQTAGMGSLWRSQHELVFVFKNGSAPHVNNVELGRHGRHRSNLWSYPGMSGFGRGRDDLLALHPTVKPVALFADAIRDCSKRGGLVLDPFVGSGTTILAAERTKRRAAAIEIDPLYADAAVRRWQALTDKAAVLDGDGRTFAEIEVERTTGQAVVESEARHG